jgi:hypothetical protein
MDAANRTASRHHGGVGMWLTWVWLVSAAIFVVYAVRRVYRLWPVLGIAVLLGPLIWPGWALMRYGQRRGQEVSESRPRQYSEPH